MKSQLAGNILCNTLILRPQKYGGDGTHTFPFLPPVYSTAFQNTHHYYHIPVNGMARRLRGGGVAARRRCEGRECVAVSSAQWTEHVFISHTHTYTHTHRHTHHTHTYTHTHHTHTLLTFALPCMVFPSSPCVCLATRRNIRRCLLLLKLASKSVMTLFCVSLIMESAVFILNADMVKKRHDDANWNTSSGVISSLERYFSHKEKKLFTSPSPFTDNDPKLRIFTHIRPALK